MTRRSSTETTERIAHLVDRIELVQGDLLDQASLVEAIRDSHPAEVYNLAAQSFVPTSWNQPVLTVSSRRLASRASWRRCARWIPAFASTSLIQRDVRQGRQVHKRGDALLPRSPYGVAKAYGHFLTVNYRESYGLYAVSGILFNHESPRRGLEFVTRKVTDGVARIHLGLAKTLRMGNLDAHRDWGFAGDYVRAMWLMLQQEAASDYVIATGEAHSVRELCELAFARVGLDYRDWVETDPAFLRPAEVDHLLGDRAGPGRNLAGSHWSISRRSSR